MIEQQIKHKVAKGTKATKSNSLESAFSLSDLFLFPKRPLELVETC